MNQWFASAMMMGLVSHGIFANTSQWGNVDYHHSDIKEPLVIMGALSLDDVTVHRLAEIQGTATINHSHLKKAVTVVGTIQAVDSQFLDGVYLKGEKAEFDGGILNGLVVESQTPATIKLSGPLQVNGSITFKGGHGTIVADQQVVIHGNVTGATVRRAV